MFFLLPRTHSSDKLLKLLYPDQKSSATLRTRDLSADLADERLYLFGSVSTEKKQRSVKARPTITNTFKVEVQ